MKKRMVSLILAAAMAGTMLAGCGGKSGQQEGAGAAGGAAGSPEAGSEGSGSADGNSYTMFMRNTYVNWIKELKWYDAAEANTGIHVEYVEGPDDFNDVYSEIDQRIISNTLPDAVMTKLA